MAADPERPPTRIERHRFGHHIRFQNDYSNETGSVSEAAARVGRSRESAYRLRRRADAAGFAAAWDAALAGRSGNRIPARKVTPDDLPTLAFEGPVRVRMYRGRFASVSRQPSNTALLRLLSQYDRALRHCDRRLWG